MYENPYFEVKCLEKRKIVVGKVIVAKGIGISSLYIGKGFVIIDEESEKE